MRLNLMACLKGARQGILLGIMATLSAFSPSSARADSDDERYVMVYPLAGGQIYYGAVDANDSVTQGMSIPRGTARPRRMFPVKEFGMPIIYKMNRPEFKGLLLRHPGMKQYNYLDPNSQSDELGTTPTPTPTPTLTPTPTPAPTPVGNVIVEVLPNNASWSFKDVNEKVYSGIGWKTIDNVPVGPVTLTWNTLSGYNDPVPNPCIKQLVQDGSVKFFEIFIPTTTNAARANTLILRYLLGLSDDPTDLDLNQDQKVNVADLIQTINELPPLTPASPIPVDGATTVSIATNLDWADCSRARSYNLYLWKTTQAEPSNPTTSALNVSLYHPPTTLDYTTTYHWRAVALNGDESTTGPIWTFTTMPQPVRVITPNGGETWDRGSQAQIHWKTSKNIAGTAVRFELWQNGAKVKEMGNGYSDLGEKTDTITVPNDISAATDYRLRVVSIWMENHGGGSESWDESDGTITIN